jgi:hypothetical protein
MEGNVPSEVGPLRPAELLNLVRRGEVKPETLLRKDDSAWFPASDVGGLFEAAVRQEVQYFCPSCKQKISRPPLTCPKCLRDIRFGEAREVKPESMSNVAIANKKQEPDDRHSSVQSWLKKKVSRKQ